MGWASAGYIFDPVAEACINNEIGDEATRLILGTLAQALKESDWDTEDESLEVFRAHQAVVTALYEHTSAGHLWGGGTGMPDGRMGYDPKRDAWTLTCEDDWSGVKGCGEIGVAPRTVADHNMLVDMWSTHSVNVHGSEPLEIDHYYIG